jgi:hypothetical protein
MSDYYNNNLDEYKEKEKKKELRLEKLEIGFFKEKPNRIIALCVSLFVGLMFTLLFYKHSLALNYFLFSVVVLIATGIIVFRDKNLDHKQFIFWAVIMLIYSSVYFRTDMTSYLVIVFLMLPVIFLLLTLYSSKKPIERYIKTFFVRAFGSIAFVDKIFVSISTLSDKKSEKKKNILNILLGIGIALALLFIIVPLMSSADIFFDKMVKDVFDSLTFLNISQLFWRIILSCVITILFFGFVYILVMKKYPKKDIENNFRGLNSTTILTVLSVIGFVYTLFAVIQFNYLFVANDSSLPKGYTMTEYARNGYFELVWLSIINFIIIVSSMFLSKNSVGVMSKTIKIILAYFNGLNYYLMISATYKMYLYQNKYGFSTEKIFVFILLIFEAIMLVLLMIRIFKPKFAYVKYSIYIGVVFWAIVSFLNVEAMSINQNIKRYENTGELDIGYIYNASGRASSPLKELYMNNSDALSVNDKGRIENYFDFGYHPDNDYLNKTYPSIKTYDETLNNMWLEFNIAKRNKHNDGRELLIYIKENQ